MESLSGPHLVESDFKRYYFPDFIISEPKRKTSSPMLSSLAGILLDFYGTSHKAYMCVCNKLKIRGLQYLIFRQDMNGGQLSVHLLPQGQWIWYTVLSSIYHPLAFY